MHNTIRWLAVAGFLLLTAACTEQQGGRVQGFVLPAGDAALGQQVFIDFKCYNCHTIEEVVLPAPEFEPPFVISLGGKLYRVKNYGELLTAVVYPDHMLAPKYQAQLKAAGKNPGLTPMPYFGDEMTVTELVNLVEFLHGQYTKLAPDFYDGHLGPVM